MKFGIEHKPQPKARRIACLTIFFVGTLLFAVGVIKEEADRFYRLVSAQGLLAMAYAFFMWPRRAVWRANKAKIYTPIRPN